MSTYRRLSVPLLFTALAMPVLAAPLKPPAYDEYGVETDPICSYALPEALKAMHQEVPSGERAQTNDWKTEIFVNRDKGTWTLVGTRLAPDWDEDEMCPLARGRSDYREQKWYRAYFLLRK